MEKISLIRWKTCWIWRILTIIKKRWMGLYWWRKRPKWWLRWRNWRIRLLRRWSWVKLRIKRGWIIWWRIKRGFIIRSIILRLGLIIRLKWCIPLGTLKFNWTRTSGIVGIIQIRIQKVVIIIWIIWRRRRWL